MAKTVSLRDANQQFTRCIREVEAGEEFVITRNGKPVARLTPVAKRRVLTPQQQTAWACLKGRWKRVWTSEQDHSIETPCMSDERFTLDTDILVYSVDRTAGVRHQRAMTIVRRALLDDCWLTLQAVSEFYAVVSRKRVIVPADAARIAGH